MYFKFIIWDCCYGCDSGGDDDEAGSDHDVVGVEDEYAKYRTDDGDIILPVPSIPIPHPPTQHDHDAEDERDHKKGDKHKKWVTVKFPYDISFVTNLSLLRTSSWPFCH